MRWVTIVFGVAFAAVLLAPVVASAQGPVVTVEDVECIPVGDNAVAWAHVADGVAETTVRLNFRRMHDEVEDFYWVEMRPAGEGRYWGVFPKAEDHELDRHELEEQREQAQEEYQWAEWWRAKEASTDRDPNDDLDDDVIRERASLGKLEPRHWMADLDDETFEQWLEQLENEPSEYFASVHEASGRRIARSDTRVVEVRRKRHCDIELTPMERGQAENLVVGEVSRWQDGEPVFHWMCDGVVTRVDPDGVPRLDQVCRTCEPCLSFPPRVLYPQGRGVASPSEF